MRKTFVLLLSSLPLLNFFVSVEYFNFRHIFIFLAFSLLLYVIKTINDKVNIFNNARILILLLIVYFTINIIFLNRFDKSFNIFISLFSSLICLFITSMCSITNDEKKLLINVHLISTLIIAIYFIFNMVPTDGNPNRFTVIFQGTAKQDPNYFASLFMLPTLLSAYSVLHFHKGKRLIYIITMLIYLFCIMLTGSRATLLCTIIGLFIINLKLIKRYFLISISLVILGFVALSFTFDLSRFFDISSYFDSSNINRLLAWKSAFYIGLESPILGQGFYAGYSLSNLYGASYNMSIHNVYLELFAETGLVGLCLFLFAVYYPVFKNKNLLIWAIFVSTFLSSCIISAHISAYFWINIVYLTLFCNSKENAVKNNVY